MTNIFQKQWFVFFVLISFIIFQLIYSFLFPSNGQTSAWLPISQYLEKFSSESSDNFLLSKIYPLISPQYRLNSDVGHYLELGRNFSKEYFAGSPFLQRPLHPFLIFLASLPTKFFIPTSYGVIFGLSILLNFILISATVILFFFLLRKLFSLKVAWLSSLLLIFSPYVHGYINQPLAEMLMAFFVVLSCFLLHNYIQKSSVFKLVLFSLIVGIFMLGKMFFALSIFILLLAICFKRCKEGVIFLMIHLAPLFLWYLWVRQVWHIPYFVNEVQNWHFGVWFFEIFYWPWQKTFQIFVNVLPDFVTALTFSFLVIPVILSVLGFRKLPFKHKNAIYFGSLSSVFLLGLIMGAYFIRHVFLLFPIIYPTAVLGMERLNKSSIFQAIIIGIIMLISSINIYQIFNYNDFHYYLSGF
ncbi:MAG: glycosyltransferase family 39 protein [Candidatus Nealsonbacteria bacterium]|nr:glycosyltransferase family 39 protein [Candidatus Nealsonbacteria bacterium]